MYMSESNIIGETAQPIFGVIGITVTTYFLFRLRSWLSLALFFSAFVFLSFGSLIDFIHERESIKEYLPNFIYYFLDMTSEERFDVIGALLFSLSAILSFQVPLRHFLVNNTKETLLILLSSGIMTVGNGLLHYQYNPDNELYLFALMLTTIGFLGIVFFGKIINKKYKSLTSITDNIFYLLLFLAFVILPSYPAAIWMIVKYSLFIWLSIIILMTIYMWRSHNTSTELVDTV